MTFTTFIAVSPVLLVALGAACMLLVDALMSKSGKTAGSLFRSVHSKGPRPVDEPLHETTIDRALASAVILGAAAILSAILWFGGYLEPGRDVGGSLLVDRLALFGFMLATLGAMLASLMSSHHLCELRADEGQFHPVLMLTTAGAMLLCASTSFIMFFLALETMSLGAYILTGMRRASPLSTEGAMKYFLMGSFASAILLYGFALLYGETGAASFEEMGGQLSGMASLKPLAMLGSTMVLVGLAFKVSAVPFHMWVPDAYQGAPTPATSFMAAVVKAAAFIAMVRVLTQALTGPILAGPPFGWASVLSVLSVITMFWGNMAALRQKNVKRMLAYSSIAHAGYILIGVVALWKDPSAVPPILYYLFTYLAANAGAFAIVSMAVKGGAEATDIEDYRGFGRTHPLLAAAMSVFLLSMLGMPPLAGFFGKLYVFSTAVDNGLWLLAVLGMVASVVSAYYYIGVIVVMFMRESADGQSVALPVRSGQIVAAVILSLVLVLELGLWPTPWFR